MDKSFTKKKLQIFSKAYDLTLQNKLKKSDMCTLLTKKILESESITNPDSFVQSPSDQVHAWTNVSDWEQEATIDEQIKITTAQQQDEEPGPSGWTGNVRKTASDDLVSREESLDQLIKIM